MVDRYTKVVLGVIAVALTVIAGHDLLGVRSAEAQFGMQHVSIDAVGGMSVLGGQGVPVHPIGQ